jgi:hypothetical protein
LTSKLPSITLYVVSLFAMSKLSSWGRCKTWSIDLQWLPVYFSCNYTSPKQKFFFLSFQTPFPDRLLPQKFLLRNILLADRRSHSLPPKEIHKPTINSINFAGRTKWPSESEHIIQ